MRLAEKLCRAVPLLIAGSLFVAGAALAGPPSKPELTVPSLTCVASTGSSITLEICGTGDFGAPYGFSIHMMTRAEYDLFGWNSTKPSYRCWSLQGTCGPPGFNSPWGLDRRECARVTISANFTIDYMDVPDVMCGASQGCGQAILQCGTEYVFRVFAHGGRDFDASPKGAECVKCPGGIADFISCTTAPCQPDGGCTYTWGYWKTHGPEGCSPGNQENDWDVSSLTIGSLNLGETALCDILHDNPNACAKGGGANAVLILEHQLIAAMLNVANGAISCPAANQAIVDANALLSGMEYACVGTSSLLGQQMLEVKNVLSAYNEDICVCPAGAGKAQAAPGATTEAKRSSWGQIKSIYR